MSLEHSPQKGVRRLRRPEQSAYLKEQWGLDYAPRTLAKLGSIGGGPELEYIGRFPTSTPAALDAFAQEKISPPVRSRSELRVLQQKALAA